MPKLAEAMIRLKSPDKDVRTAMTLAKTWLNGIKCSVDVMLLKNNVSVWFRDGADWSVLVFGPGERFMCSSSIPIGGDLTDKIAEVRRRFDR